MEIGMNEASQEHVLIAGASFAGLTLAFWLHQLGFRVTLVDIAPGLKKGGTPVDIRGRTVDIVKRMGIFDAVRASSLVPRPTLFKTVDDTTIATLAPQADGDDRADAGFEIERDALLDILFETIADKAEVLFGTTITSLSDGDANVDVAFSNGTRRAFALVFGCDGNHSAVRKMHFGAEAQYSHFLGLYFAIAIVDKRIVEKNTTHICSVPGNTVMLSSYENKTDVVFCFHRDEEVLYDYRDVEQQRQIVDAQFRGMGWHVPTLLDEVRQADNFYFDKMCQIKMAAWTRGRVALVGDAAYCASPAAGMGGSLAIIGATALADALAHHKGDFARAFEEYGARLAPFVAEVQADAVNFGLSVFAPKTEQDIRERDARFLAE